MRSLMPLFLLCCISQLSFAGNTLSVFEKARIVNRVLNQVDTVIDYVPYHRRHQGYIGLPVFVGDDFFERSDNRDSVQHAVEKLVRLFVLSDSARYYRHFALLFIDMVRPERSYKVEYIDSTLTFRRSALPVEQRYDVLESLVAVAHWRVKKLTGDYRNRHLGLLLNDTLSGVKLDDVAMNRMALDLGQLMYEFVLDRDKKIVPVISVSFNDSAYNADTQLSVVFYRMFWMEDAEDKSLYAFR